MSTISIKRPIVVKVVVTEEFRKQLIEEALNTVKKIEENIKQIESIPDTKAGSSQSKMEELKRMKNDLSLKIKELEQVKEGQELPFRVFEGNVQLDVGDNFLQKMTKAEVVVKDWKVIEIREP